MTDDPRVTPLRKLMFDTLRADPDVTQSEIPDDEALERLAVAVLACIAGEVR